MIASRKKSVCSVFLPVLFTVLLGNHAVIDAKPNCTCGVSTPGDRVVGGYRTKDRMFPWLVAIVPAANLLTRYCDGALVTRQYIVTAFHCLKDPHPSEVLARIGTFDFNNTKEKGSLIVGFEGFMLARQDDGYYNDLAIGILEREIDFSPTIMPICMTSQGVDYTNVQAVVAGWGETSYRGVVSRYPEAVTMPVVSTEECKKPFEKIGTNIRENELCAGDLKGRKDSCQGDSGGPLMYFNKDIDRWLIIGVVSFGVGCATKGYYGVYMNMSYYSSVVQNAINYSACVTG